MGQRVWNCASECKSVLTIWLLSREQERILPVCGFRDGMRSDGSGREEYGGAVG